MSVSNRLCKPFLRWAGGKSWLAKEIMDRLFRYKFSAYYEPFLGSGAIFFALRPQENVFLSDINKELIETYKTVRDIPDQVINELKQFENTKDFYYYIRNHVFIEASKKAAQFIYLNQTSYNGLYRVNNNGQYNVPYGFRKKDFLEQDKIYAASKSLKYATIACEDFSAFKETIVDGSFVFLDPPYTVSHNDNGFIKYNRNLFSLEDQQRLSLFIDHIKSRNAFYLLTNAAHPEILEIFTKEGDTVFALERASLIGGKNAVRGKVKEYLFTNLNI